MPISFVVHIFEAYKNILYNNVKENRKFTTLGKLTVSILRITYTYVRITAYVVKVVNSIGI